MPKNTSRTIFAVAIALLIVGGGIYVVQTYQSQNSETNDTEVTSQEDTKNIISKTYSNDLFTLQYPSNYTVSTNKSGIVTISNGNSKIMVGNFEPAAAPAATADMTQDQKDEFPKDTRYHGREASIASAIYFETGDESAQNELNTIQNSIVLK